MGSKYFELAKIVVGIFVFSEKGAFANQKHKPWQKKLTSTKHTPKGKVAPFKDILNEKNLGEKLQPQFSKPTLAKILIEVA